MICKSYQGGRSCQSRSSPTQVSPYQIHTKVASCDSKSAAILAAGWLKFMAKLQDYSICEIHVFQVFEHHFVNMFWWFLSVVKNKLLGKSFKGWKIVWRNSAAISDPQSFERTKKTLQLQDLHRVCQTKTKGIPSPLMLKLLWIRHLRNIHEHFNYANQFKTHICQHILSQAGN